MAKCSMLSLPTPSRTLGLVRDVLEPQRDQGFSRARVSLVVRLVAAFILLFLQPPKTTTAGSMLRGSRASSNSITTRIHQARILRCCLAGARLRHAQISSYCSGAEVQSSCKGYCRNMAVVTSDIHL